MKRITFVLGLLLLLSFSSALAQTIKVTGTIIGKSDNQPIPGADIIVKGTKSGTSADANGQYVINVRRDAVLVFSFMGYKTLEVPVDGKSVIDVELEEDAEMLEPTIVVGYGTARKISSVVGSAQTVRAKTLKDKPVINAGDALQGAVAGLQVYSSSGDPSATVSMRIRGVNSLTLSNTPLFVLDGTPVASDIFSTISANDIETVTILKDASSTAIYGSRAANGVVYITTKKGTGEKPNVKLSFNYGISNLARFPIEGVNSEQWFELAEIVNPLLKTDPDFQANKDFRLKNNIGTDWMKWMLNQNAPTVGADFSISSRTKRSDYYVSVSANRQEGIEPHTAMNRYTARVNLNSKATDWFRFGINMSVAYQASRENPSNADYDNDNRNSMSNPTFFALRAVPWWSARDILKDASGNFIGYGDEQTYLEDYGGWNHFYRWTYTPRKNNLARLNGNLYEEFIPIKGLTIRFAQGFEGYDYRFKAVNYVDPLGLRTSGGASESFQRFYRLTTSNTIEYRFQLGENHNFSLLGGQEAIIANTTSFGTSSTGQTDARLWAINQGTTYGAPSWSYTQRKDNSLFSRFSYDYAGKYYLDASFRRDGSSVFGADNRYANFWSVGGMWDIRKESAFKNLSWLNKLQLSASYGTVGNSGISSYFGIGTIGGGGSQYDGTRSWYISNSENRKLTWETLKTLNIGLDFRVWDKLEAKIEYYRKMTANMLLLIPWSYSTGFSGGYGNIGNMKNEGVEATISYDFIRSERAFLQVSLNASYNKDKIVNLFDGRDYFERPSYGLKYMIGHSPGEFWYQKFAGIDPANGRALWYDKDGNITNVFSEDDRVLLGKSRYAPWAGGVQIDFVYRQFSLQAQFSGVFGKYMMNNDKYFYTNTNFASNRRLAVDVLKNVWTTPGQQAKYPNPAYVVNSECFDSRLVENASFVRLKGLTLSYSLGKNALNSLGGVLTGVRIFATGRNLFTITKYTGWDPEQDTNVSLGSYPNSKQYSAGIELTF